MKKHLKYSKDYGNLSSTFYNIAFVYLSVMLWIVSSSYSSAFKLHLCNLFFRSVFSNINDFCASRICYSFDFVFSMFGVFLEKFNDPVWNESSYFAVKEGNITLNVYNIPIFHDLKKLFPIEPPDPPSVSNLLIISNKPTYSSYTPATDACKLSHLELTAFFLF